MHVEADQGGLEQATSNWQIPNPSRESGAFLPMAVDAHVLFCLRRLELGRLPKDEEEHKRLRDYVWELLDEISVENPE